ncbi:MAG TPA: acetyl-CoA C-acetyltransferase [Candidatus Deferrimicrobium sp.]|nr:acetyl-CoA C-acetyltransferase [Candidatus Deferrimicrobium sp.]
MVEVVIVDYLRTAFSRSRPREAERDVFNQYRADDLAGFVIEDLIKRTKIDPKDVGDVLTGSAFQLGENWMYGGRTVSLIAKLPLEVPAMAIDRQCASSMSTIHIGAMEIMAGFSDVVIAGGMEHMTHVPMGENVKPSSKLGQHPSGFDAATAINMGLTAEKLFLEAQEKYGMTREDMDKWALQSHDLAQKAVDAGFFKGEILPLEIDLPDGAKKVINKDDSIRAGSSLEKMAQLKAVFKRKGNITAGNSSPLNAGAAFVMLMSPEKANQYGLKPLAKIKSMAVAGVDPSVMGKGPVPASQKALAKAGLKVEDIDYWEINEAFCVVALWAIKELGLDPSKVNIMGGATALGHPLGASGARLTGTLARILQLKKGKYGLANLCVGGGQGAATILERI